MHLQISPTYLVKYRNEESEDKTLRELINEKGVAEVTAKEEGRVNIGRSVKMKYCFGGEVTPETTMRRKTPR